jgi:hypothetical protein
MTAEMKSAAEAVAGAVTGEGSPDRVKVTRPTTGALWALFAAGGGLMVIVFLIIGILTWWHPWPEMTSLERIKILGVIAFAAMGCLAVLIFALASPWVGKVSAEAGPAKFGISSKDD